MIPSSVCTVVVQTPSPSKWRFITCTRLVAVVLTVVESYLFGGHSVGLNFLGSDFHLCSCFIGLGLFGISYNWSENLWR